MRIALLTSAAVLALAAPARADILVNAPKPELRCGQSIRLGVWYRDHPTTGHPRTVLIAVESEAGAVLFHRRVQAPAEWRFWSYKPRCGRRYRVRYTTYRGVDTFRVRVHRA
jgi:hypothetical protein